VDLEVQVVVGRTTRIADGRDHVARTYARTDRDAQLRVVIVGREDVAVAFARVVQDRDDVRAGFGLPCEGDRPVGNRTHGRAGGVVELHALVLLEVAAHGRPVP